jgi:hypothetical protein
MNAGLGIVGCIALVAASGVAAGAGKDDMKLGEGYWSEAQVRAILDRTVTVRLAPSLGHLSEAERAALAELLEAGAIIQRVYESSLHPQALEAAAELQRIDAAQGSPARTRELLDLYRLFHGPIATTLENERVPFLPVRPQTPGRNVYPEGITRDEIEAWLAAHPDERAALLGERTVVRRATADALRRDVAQLDRHPELDALHPGLRDALQARLTAGDERALYAVPYSVAYADELAAVRDRLYRAAAAIEKSDRDFADYLRLRARDLQADDYEGGDAAWVRGHFGTLNAQIGSYETYDDKLYGAKSFFSLSVLVRDPERSAGLARAAAGLQALQDALPYEGERKVSEDIPIGVYDVVADFGQSRGTNTASILPNDPDHARKYGRTILIRQNIIGDPALFRESLAGFAAALPAHRNDLTPEAELQRTLWHELGHYLGPDRAMNGEPVSDALAEYGDLVEEMKSDLVSLWSARAHRAAGTIDDAGLRAWYASGVRRTLQKVKPLREQPYQTMQLMQMNWFLEHGLLHFRDGVLEIDFDVYHDVVTELLKAVLELQVRGDRAAAGAFVERWGSWDEKLHGVIAKKIDAASPNRYRLVRYEALGE